MNTQDGKLPWHPAFSAALHIEFEDDLEHLHFHEEYPLGTQPMRMDILIIKKDPDVHIRKNIGQIFRTYNVIEYKPPGVSLSINHFYKAYGYACFFQSDTEKECEIDPDEITVTYVCYHYPRKLLKYLTAVRSLTVKKAESGIYYLEGTFFKVQLLVTSRLSSQQNYWLSHLRNNLKQKATVQDLLKHYGPRMNSPYYQAVVTLILRANENLLKEEEHMNPVLEEFFGDQIKKLEERSMMIGEKQGIKQGISQGINQGISQGIELTKTVLKLSQNGTSPADIVSKYNIEEDLVKKILS